MDPQETWNRLLEAWNNRDWEELEAAAKDLKHWMKRGGFPPEVTPSRRMGALWNRAVVSAACEFSTQVAWRVLQSPNGIPRGFPFTVSCCECGTAAPSSYDQAVAAGWMGIEFRPDLPTKNFLGYCPNHVPSPPWEESDWVVTSEWR